MLFISSRLYGESIFPDVFRPAPPHWDPYWEEQFSLYKCSVRQTFIPSNIYIFDTKKCRILPMVGDGGSVHPAVGNAARQSGQTRYFHPALKKSPKNPRIFWHLIYGESTVMLVEMANIVKGYSRLHLCCTAYTGTSNYDDIPTPPPPSHPSLGGLCNQHSHYICSFYEVFFSLGIARVARNTDRQRKSSIYGLCQKS